MFHDQQRKFRSAVAHHPVGDAVRPAVPSCRHVSGDDALDDLMRALRDERGMADATLLGLRRSLTPFFTWLAARGRAWQDAALEDVTAYLHVLVVPSTAFGPHPIEELPEAPTWIPRYHVRQRRDHKGIPSTRGNRRPVKRRPREPHHTTGPLHRQLVLTDEHLGDLSLRERPYSFRLSTSLMAAFSRAKSAYIRFSLAFSASSSRRRFTSETVAPPYLLRHLKNVDLLTPCLRSKSATATPLSASLRIPTIWLSLNFDFRMTVPDPEQSTLTRDSHTGLDGAESAPPTTAHRPFRRCERKRHVR